MLSPPKSFLRNTEICQIRKKCLTFFYLCSCLEMVLHIMSSYNSYHRIVPGSLTNRTSIQQLERTESCRLLRNFSVGKQNRVDQSVPLLRLILTKPLKHGFQGSVPSLNKFVTNGVVWYTGETLYAE